MKILQILHSFIAQTIAGTEVYVYNLSRELAQRHNVFIFFRVNNPKAKEYALIYNHLNGIETYAINRTFKGISSFRQTYRDESVEKAFANLLDTIKPDIAHIHNLLFLSHGIVNEIKKRQIPLVFTLHDYGLICYKGLLIKDDMSICSGFSIHQCRDCLKYVLGINKYLAFGYRLAKQNLPACLLGLLRSYYSVISKPGSLAKIEEWKESINEIIARIDQFIAPSNFIRDKFIEQGFDRDRVLYLANGIKYDNIVEADKTESDKLRFAYIGTLLPAKGVDILISAFRRLNTKKAELFIYGKLQRYAGFEGYPGLLKKIISRDKRVKLMAGFANQDIGKVLADIDVLVVPSIWPENSPLVIQEAFLSKTPVVASRVGGIAELVSDGLNGLLFGPGDIDELQERIQYIIDNPKCLQEFRGNIQKVKSIEENAKEIEIIYNRLLSIRSRSGGLNLSCGP